VPARTLQSVIDDAGLTSIDLLSLDVEGYEPQVLDGLDLARCRPTYIVVECLDENAEARVAERLAGSYDYLDRVSPRDLLFRAVPFDAASAASPRTTSTAPAPTFGQS
jgi:hypothetical protein